MIRFSGNDIEITRGDTLLLSIRFGGLEEPEGARAVFTLKNKPGDALTLIRREAVPDEEGRAVFCLSSSDTDLTPGTRWWDVRLFLSRAGGADEVRTPMDCASFTVLEAVGDV